MSDLEKLPPADRHTHDCDRCVYMGTTFSSASGAQMDWYVCPAPNQDVLVRWSPRGPDYSSACFKFSWPHTLPQVISQALANGVLKLVPNV